MILYNITLNLLKYLIQSILKKVQFNLKFVELI